MIILKEKNLLLIISKVQFSMLSWRAVEHWCLKLYCIWMSYNQLLLSLLLLLSSLGKNEIIFLRMFSENNHETEFKWQHRGAY